MLGADTCQRLYKDHEPKEEEHRDDEQHELNAGKGGKRVLCKFATARPRGLRIIPQHSSSLDTRPGSSSSDSVSSWMTWAERSHADG